MQSDPAGLCRVPGVSSPFILRRGSWQVCLRGATRSNMVHQVRCMPAVCPLAHARCQSARPVTPHGTGPRQDHPTVDSMLNLNCDSRRSRGSEVQHPGCQDCGQGDLLPTPSFSTRACLGVAVEAADAFSVHINAVCGRRQVLCAGARQGGPAALRRDLPHRLCLCVHA